MAITILKVNDSLKILMKDDVCLLFDPWRFDQSKLRKDALSCKAFVNLQMSNNFLVNTLMNKKMEEMMKDIKNDPYLKPELHVKRIAASKFQITGAVDHNETADGQTIYTQMLIQMKRGHYKNFIKKGINERCLRVYFGGESSIDDGGPLREVLEFVCMELQTSSLPVLIPTPNRQSGHGEMRHCFLLSHMCGMGQYAKEENEMLYFFGVLIGFGILSTNPLFLSMSPTFWKQVVSTEELTTEADLLNQDQYSW
jgi:hypothetical protein